MSEIALYDVPRFAALRRVGCRLRGHRDSTLYRVADRWRVTTWAHCGRCGRVVVQTRITVAGIDREMRRVLIPSLRESLNAENPLMRWVSGAEPDAG